MDARTLFNLGNEFFNEGRKELAMELWNRASDVDRNFREIYINQINVYRAEGNLFKERETIFKFLNSTQTGVTIELIPLMKGRLVEIEKQLNPQSQPQVQK